MSYENYGKFIGELVDRKNRAYGNSFNLAGEIIKILYPNGIKPDSDVLADLLGIIRVIDKLFRIANHPDAMGESPWEDIAGYALLGAARHNLRREDQFGAHQCQKRPQENP